MPEVILSGMKAPIEILKADDGLYLLIAELLLDPEVLKPQLKRR